MEIDIDEDLYLNAYSMPCITSDSPNNQNSISFNNCIFPLDVARDIQAMQHMYCRQTKIQYEEDEFLKLLSQSQRQRPRIQ